MSQTRGNQDEINQHEVDATSQNEEFTFYDGNDDISHSQISERCFTILSTALKIIEARSDYPLRVYPYLDRLEHVANHSIITEEAVSNDCRMLKTFFNMEVSLLEEEKIALINILSTLELNLIGHSIEFDLLENFKEHCLIISSASQDRNEISVDKCDIDGMIDYRLFIHEAYWTRLIMEEQLCVGGECEISLQHEEDGGRTEDAQIVEENRSESTSNRSGN